MANISQLKLLSPEEVSTIYDKSLELLSGKGVKVGHLQALKMLDKAGAQVDFDSHQVRFPRDIIEMALQKVPHTLMLANRNEHKDIILPNPTGTFYTRNGSGALNYLDPDSNTYHDMTVAYVERCGQLMEALDQIDLCAFPSPSDVPEETADIHALKALLENTSKHINIQPYSVESVEYLLELGMVVAGSKEALRKRPIISLTPNAFSPMAIKDVDAEVIIQACRYGVPIQVATLPTAGATSPATIAGTVLQTIVELLAMIVVVQLINSGNPVFAFPCIFTLDMVTGRSIQASAEAILARMATIQLLKDAYHVPVNAYALGTDSAIPDGQSMIQTALTGVSVSMAGADILSGAGMVDAYLGISPVQMVIDNMLVGILRRVNSGVKVDDDTLAWKEILDTVPMTGHYLERAHTLKHCRDAIRPELFVYVPAEIWRSEGGKDLYTRALDKYRGIKKGLKPLELPKEVQMELDWTVKKADEHLVK